MHGISVVKIFVRNLLKIPQHTVSMYGTVVIPLFTKNSLIFIICHFQVLITVFNYLIYIFNSRVTTHDAAYTHL